MRITPKTKKLLMRFLWDVLDVLRSVLHFILSVFLFGGLFAVCGTIPVLVGLSLGGHNEALVFLKSVSLLQWAGLAILFVLLVIGVAATRGSDRDER